MYYLHIPAKFFSAALNEQLFLQKRIFLQNIIIFFFLFVLSMVFLLISKVLENIITTKEHEVNEKQVPGNLI